MYSVGSQTYDQFMAARDYAARAHFTWEQEKNKSDRPQMILFIGVQAAGKSTFYKHFLYSTHVRVNLDMLKTRNRERLLITACLEGGVSFVVDNTNPTRADRDRYMDMAVGRNFEVVGYYFQSRLSSCLSRNMARQSIEQVPDTAIRATHSKLVLPQVSEGFDRLYYVRAAAGFEVKEWDDNEERQPR